MAAVTATAVLTSDRYSDEVVLSAAASNLDNTGNTWTITLPAGFGDCLLLEAQFYQSGIVTLQAAALAQNIQLGPSGWVIDQADITRDFIDTVPWLLLTLATPYYIACRMAPDQPVLVRAVERLFFYLPAMDTDAGDASDISVFLRVKRLRNTGVGV